LDRKIIFNFLSTAYMVVEHSLNPFYAIYGYMKWLLLYILDISNHLKSMMWNCLGSSTGAPQFAHSLVQKNQNKIVDKL